MENHIRQETSMPQPFVWARDTAAPQPFLRAYWLKSGMEEQFIQFYQETIVPWLKGAWGGEVQEAQVWMASGDNLSLFIFAPFPEDTDWNVIEGLGEFLQHPEQLRVTARPDLGFSQ
jgi:hypothetical protein